MSLRIWHFDRVPYLLHGRDSRRDALSFISINSSSDRFEVPFVEKGQQSVHSQSPHSPLRYEHLPLSTGSCNSTVSVTSNQAL